MAINNGAVPGASLTARLESLKSTIQRGQTEKARAEATLEQLGKQEAEIVAELTALGVTPDGLDAEIERLRREVEAGLAEAERLLNGDAQTMSNVAATR